jgi:hypothetical protein
MSNRSLMVEKRQPAEHLKQQQFLKPSNAAAAGIRKHFLSMNMQLQPLCD